MTPEDATAADALDPDSIERLVPDRFDPEDRGARETLDLHLERYRFAAKQTRPGRLLDCACGVGYGTRLLADHATGLESALGVDISAEAIAYAKERYGGGIVSYLNADAVTFRDERGFDTIVSLETVEHLPDPQTFFAGLVAMLRPGGVLVSSVPTTPSVDLNPHHLHDFTPRSFRGMGAGHGLRELAAFKQVQTMHVSEIFRPRRFKLENLRPNLPGYYLTHPGAFVKRVGTTLRYGLANHYLTIAWERPEQAAPHP